MNPRLKTSKKWTAFPKEYLAQIEEVFNQGFKAQIGDAKLVVEGRIYPSEILLRVGLLEKGRLKQANFEVSCEYSAQKQDALQTIHDCIDAAASMMAEYFENDEEVDFPYSWKEYKFNERPVYLQFSTVNTDLEAQADALLGESSEDLVTEDAGQDSEDALERADESLPEPEDEEGFGLDEDVSEEDEDDATEGPTMFSGRGKKKKEDLH